MSHHTEPEPNALKNLLCRAMETFLGVSEILQIVKDTHQEVKKIMAELVNVTDALAAAKAAAEAERVENLGYLATLKDAASALTGQVSSLSQQVADLQAQIAAGTAATPADLDTLVASINDMASTISGIVTPEDVA